MDTDLLTHYITIGEEGVQVFTKRSLHEHRGNGKKVLERKGHS